jgi:hypothetical protein
MRKLARVSNEELARIVNEYYTYAKRKDLGINVTSWKKFCLEKGHRRDVFNRGLKLIQQREGREMEVPKNYYPSDPLFERDETTVPESKARRGIDYFDPNYMDQIYRAYEDYLSLREKSNKAWEWRNFCIRNKLGPKIFEEGIKHYQFPKRDVERSPWPPPSLYPIYSSKKVGSVLDIPRDVLDPDLWEMGEIPILRKEVKEEILSKVYDWLEKQGVGSDWIRDIYFIGSSAGYQWRKTSDIDITLIPDPVALKNSAERVFGEDGIKKLIKKMITELNDYEIGRHPVNYYIKTDGSLPVGEAIYNILKEEWAVRPQKLPEDFDPEKIYKSEILQAEARLSTIDTVIGQLSRRVKDCFVLMEYDRQDKIDKKLRRIYELCLWLRNELLDIKRRRKKAYEQQGRQDTKENILYKYFERYGYLEFLEKVVKIAEEGVEVDELPELKEALVELVEEE